MFHIEHNSWQSRCQDIRRVRECVFVYECRIPKTVEFDAADPLSEHVVVYDDEQPIATGRLCPDGYLSRVAVIPSKRKTQAAKIVIQHLTDIAKRKKMEKLMVSSDLLHVSDMLSQGFQPCSGVYMEAGVARQKFSCPTHQFCSTCWVAWH
ncbi:GNAT family N-acetyltransferase [Catenovulum sp. SM1970]|uniref:GNAT family N-acetyltransferase n=1 Tax=Marinifaba aquimaris TaxID=2741323 RepID=UPI0015745E66|nr:GNAT family N-acetyltransferase [Marinifaba aquimaris]NTS78239.1 GNAT family N-acetyltransferase [Marinifaba aquimaris]